MLKIDFLVAMVMGMLRKVRGPFFFFNGHKLKIHQLSRKSETCHFQLILLLIINHSNIQINDIKYVLKNRVSTGGLSLRPIKAELPKLDKKKNLNFACILTDFNYATLTSPYIFQKTVECKLPLLQ